MVIVAILILLTIAECVLVIDSVWYKALHTSRVDHKSAWIMSALAGIVLIGLIMQAASINGATVCTLILNFIIAVGMAYVCCVIRKW